MNHAKLVEQWITKNPNERLKVAKAAVDMTPKELLEFVAALATHHTFDVRDLYMLGRMIEREQERWYRKEHAAK